MRTVKTKVYLFNELSEEAKETAIENYRNKDYDNSVYYDDITESVKAVIDLFNLSTGREYSDIRTDSIDDTILELSGARLYTYLINNYYSDLFKPEYIKTLDREFKANAFICKVKTNHKGEKYTQIFSKFKVSNECVLTGVCYDNNILEPIYSFLKKPTNETFEDLLQDIGHAISRAYSDMEEWLYSVEYITDSIQGNDYEFTKEGNIF